MKIDFIDLSRMHNPIKSKLETKISEIISKGDFILGKEVEKFEERFANYCGVKHAIGVSSGTDALELILRSLGIGKGDEVITVPNSFISTASSISYCGAKVVFTDVDYQTSNISPTEIEKHITKNTKAIIPVHLYGNPAEIDKIIEIAEKNDILVIEDACQAHGAEYKNRKIGSFGIASAFSFYPTKNLGCCGDGGMVVTNDDYIAAKIKKLRNYGQSEKNHHDFLALNKRLDNLQAAILNIKLDYLDEWNQLRRECAKKFNKGLQGSVKIPYITNDSTPVFHLYVINTRTKRERDSLKNFLESRGISTMIHYPIPIHLQKCYSDLGFKKGDYPIAEKLSETCLSLPMFPGIKDEEINYIIDSIKDFFKK